MKRGDILYFPTVRTYVMFIEFEQDSTSYLFGLIIGYSVDLTGSLYFIGDLDNGWPVVGAVVTDLTIEFT